MKKTTITLGIAAAMSAVLLGSCGLGQKHDESEVRFTHMLAEASYRLVGSGADYEYADSCDLSFGSKAEFIMPEVLLGKDVRQLQDTIMMLAFNKKGEDVARVMRESLPAMASEVGYELADTVLPDSVVAKFPNFLSRYDGVSSVSGEVETLNPEFMSYAVTCSGYIPGAAHGMYATYYVNYDMTEGKIVTLGDLFTDEGLESLVGNIRSQAREMRDVIGPTDIDALPSKGNFYITDDNSIVFAYPPYEVASYAQGEVKIPIPAYLLSTGLTPVGNRLLLNQ